MTSEINKDVRVQPHSDEAEQAVLGAILVDGDKAFERAAPWIREDEAFYRTDNRVIWEAIKSLHKERSEIDVITTINRVKDTHPHLSLTYHITGLIDITTTANLETHARIVWERHIQRETAKSAQLLYQSSYESTEKTKGMLEEHSRLVEELQTLNPSKNREIESIVNESMGYIKEGGNIIPYGNIAMDAPAGGMTRKEITVIGGRPGHGKTTLVINIVRTLVEQGYKVMMFNREMSNSEMMKKFLVMESAGLAYSEVRKGNLTEAMTVELEETGKEINEKYKDLLLMYDDIPTLDEAMIEISRHKPDVVIDDYIQLISMPDRMERRFQLEKIMLDYKWVCKKENCAALLVSQLNRNMESRVDPRPKMSDYAESGVIEQTVEAAMFVFYGYNFDDQTYGKYESEVISAKTRYGKVGKCLIGFNGNKCRFYASPEEAQNDEPNKYKPKAQAWLQ
jgi:replicative DNA helicase